MRHPLIALSICGLALAGFARPAAAQANNSAGELSVLFWTPEPVLTLQSGALATATGITSVDFVEEFGIANETFPEFRLVAGGSHKFRLGYVPVRHQAEAIVQRTITFRGQTFAIGAPAATEINWNIWRFGYEWDFVSREYGFVGLIADLRYNTLDASIESPVLATAATTEQKAVIPTVGVIGRGYLHPNVAVTGEFSFLDLDLEDEFVASHLDFDVNAFVTIGNHFGVQGGYRHLAIDYEIDDDIGDLELKGLYFGGIVKF